MGSYVHGMCVPIGVSVSSGESTRQSSSVTELGSVVECCPPHQHLCREGEGDIKQLFTQWLKAEKSV